MKTKTSRRSFGIIVFPGSNCDMDCYHVAKNVLGQRTEYVWHQETDLSRFDCVLLPGGFSYGDYLRTGAVARFSPVLRAIQDFATAGKLVIGICNGFQILCEARLLPGVLTRNTCLRFICKHVSLRVENKNSIFSNQYDEGQVVNIPIAHNEGNYYADEATLAELKANDQILFRYCSTDGQVAPEYNPNGSLENIAGIINREGNVLGMMPHPERCSEGVLGSTDGLKLFESIMQ